MEENNDIIANEASKESNLKYDALRSKAYSGDSLELDEGSSHKIFTLPNAISFARILLTAVASYLLIAGFSSWALLVYIITAATDFFDGYLARKLNQITELGKVLDPLADKLMVGSALIILLTQGRTELWFVIVFIGREVFQLLGGLWLSRRISHIPPSNMFGKVAAATTMLTFMLCILDFKYIEYCYYASTILLFASSFVYGFSALRQIDKKLKNYQ